LSIQRRIGIAQALESLQGKFVVGTLRLLQAQNIRPDKLENLATASMRNRTELMFQVAIVSISGIRCRVGCGA
jgi:hypothetical protein